MRSCRVEFVYWMLKEPNCMMVGVTCTEAMAKAMSPSHKSIRNPIFISASFTKWEPGMPGALGDQLRRPRLK